MRLLQILNKLLQLFLSRAPGTLMKLLIWLEIQEMSLREFAKKIDKNPSLVHKYLFEGVVPKANAMRDIFLTTCGAVTANDFYDLSDQMFKTELARRKNAIQEPEMDFRY